MPPAKKVRPLVRGPATRIAALVNERFDGNISEAAKALKCSYDALYHAARGARKPSADLYVKLHHFTGQSIDWWMMGEG